MWRKSRCVICKAKFDNPGVFPKDFPPEWKMCCNCSGIAKVIARSSFARVCRILNPYFLKRAEKINELITVI